MMATTLSVAFSVMVVKIHFKSPENRPPQWLRIVVFRYLAKLVCISNYKSTLKHSPKRRRVQRDITWSDTCAEEIKSQTNSHGTISPDVHENYELTSQSRRRILAEDSNYDVTSSAASHSRAHA